MESELRVSEPTSLQDLSRLARHKSTCDILTCTKPSPYTTDNIAVYPGVSDRLVSEVVTWEALPVSEHYAKLVYSMDKTTLESPPNVDERYRAVNTCHCPCIYTVMVIAGALGSPLWVCILDIVVSLRECGLLTLILAQTEVSLWAGALILPPSWCSMLGRTWGKCEYPTWQLHQRDGKVKHWYWPIRGVLC